MWGIEFQFTWKDSTLGFCVVNRCHVTLFDIDIWRWTDGSPFEWEKDMSL